MKAKRGGKLYGYIIIPRMFLENDELCRSSEFLAVYAYILSKACFKEEGFAMWEKKQIKLKKGELVTSVRKISKDTKIPQTNVVRILEIFKKWNIIGTKSSSRQTLVSIDLTSFFKMCLGTKWEQYWNELKEKQDEKEKRSKREKEEIKEKNNKGERRNKGAKNSFWEDERLSSFDTEEFFQAALERSDRHIRERANAHRIEAGKT